MEEYLKNIISKKEGIKKDSIRFNCDGERFWIDILNENFTGDIDNDDPVLEQYVLVPISKIQDRLEIELECKSEDKCIF